MDPTATYKEMIEALADGDMSAALEHADNLLDWMLCSGFGPDGIGVHRALTICSSVRRAIIMPR